MSYISSKIFCNELRVIYLSSLMHPDIEAFVFIECIGKDFIWHSCSLKINRNMVLPSLGEFPCRYKFLLNESPCSVKSPFCYYQVQVRLKFRIFAEWMEYHNYANLSFMLSHKLGKIIIASVYCRIHVNFP